jgi:hypothetical protein
MGTCSRCVSFLQRRLATGLESGRRQIHEEKLEGNAKRGGRMAQDAVKVPRRRIVPTTRAAMRPCSAAPRNKPARALHASSLQKTRTRDKQIKKMNAPVLAVSLLADAAGPGSANGVFLKFKQSSEHQDMRDTTSNEDSDEGWRNGYGRPAWRDACTSRQRDVRIKSDGTRPRAV